MSKGRIYNWLQRVWYADGWFGWALLPLSWLYQAAIALRRVLYERSVFKSHRAPIPVIVVGNITAGGTGKTPTVLWLVEALRGRGFKPGVVSRGYGGSQSGTSMRVEADSDAAVVGDEPALLARRGQCPVVVDPDRTRAAAMLAEDGCDVIVADDGLQHYRLARDFEICVIDGSRGLGNRRLLPAGPLREPAKRLDTVDQVLVNGETFELVAGDASRLNGSLARPLERFANTTVHAIAAIGNPQRFFDLLRSQGIQVIEHAYPDHAALTPASLEFGDDFDVFMTEKDAVKLGRNMRDKFWCVPVELQMDPAQSDALLEQVEKRITEFQR